MRGPQPEVAQGQLEEVVADRIAFPWNSHHGVNLLNPFRMVLALTHLRLSTISSLRTDAEAGALTDTTTSAITADLSSTGTTPPNIQAIIAAIMADLPAILSLIAALAPLFGG
jgi:hypothetical protein